MHKKTWMISYSIRFMVMGLAAAVLAGCQGPQGPTWKENVSEALKQFYLGEDELKKGNFEEAEQHYLASIEISPRPVTYVRMSQIRSHNEDLDGALENVNAALKIAPFYQRAIVYREQLLLRKNGGATPSGDAKTVETSLFQQSPIIQEPVAPAVSIPKEEISEAKIEDTQKQTETEPAASVNDMMQEAREASKSGDWQKSQSIYDKIIEKDTQNAILQYNYGYTCYQLNQLEKAKNAFQRAVKLDPDLVDAYNDLGVTLEKLNQSAEAAQAYQQAIDIGGNSDAFFNLALLTEKKGQYKESVELYEKYLELDDSSTYADYARQRIEKLRRLAF